MVCGLIKTRQAYPHSRTSQVMFAGKTSRGREEQIMSMGVYQSKFSRKIINISLAAMAMATFAYPLHAQQVTNGNSKVAQNAVPPLQAANAAPETPADLKDKNSPG